MAGAIEVTAEAVDQLHRRAAGSRRAAATINRHTQLLAQAFRLAIERKHISTAPQIRHLSEKGKNGKDISRTLNFACFFRNFRDYLKDFVQFGYLTGWRKGELPRYAGRMLKAM